MKKIVGLLLVSSIFLTACGAKKEWPKADLSSNEGQRTQEATTATENKETKHLKEKLKKVESEAEKAKKEAKKAREEIKKKNFKPKKAHIESPEPEKTKVTERLDWGSERAEELSDLMMNFGSVMGQDYEEAYPNGHEINYYGYKYPSDVSKNNFALNNDSVNMSIRNSVVEKNTYQIVGIYSDIEHPGKGGAHLYFFTLKDNQPHVLVTSQNQGNPENLLYFKESENQDLVANFKSIAAGNGHNFSGPAKVTRKNSGLSDYKKKAITNEFYVWATNQAKKGDMAITTLYFNHGAAGRGDWYAQTPDGKMLVQDNTLNLPGREAFPIDIIGGMLFFYALDGNVGHDDKISSGSTADGYTLNLDVSLPASKYILGDNGTVYELKKAAGDGLSPGSGFTECNDDGSFNTEYPPTPLIVSEDSAAQTKLQELITKYT